MMTSGCCWRVLAIIVRYAAGFASIGMRNLPRRPPSTSTIVWGKKPAWKQPGAVINMHVLYRSAADLCYIKPQLYATLRVSNEIQDT
jgi:hypothetical protein